MRAWHLLGVLTLAFLLTACASAGGASGPSALTRIDVTLSDAFAIEPRQMTVPAGVPVTFVIRNAGVIDHEFYLGDTAAQDAHEGEMAIMQGWMHDHPEGIGVHPGETRELTFTFGSTGDLLAGCHLIGHYGAGMHASVSVVPAG